jgi:hypothetical protein
VWRDYFLFTIKMSNRHDARGSRLRFAPGLRLDAAAWGGAGQKMSDSRIAVAFLVRHYFSTKHSIMYTFTIKIPYI